MWGRDINFKVSMIFELRNCENKISLSEVFLVQPLKRKRLNESACNLYPKIIKIISESEIYGFIDKIETLLQL
jgi:hypothetical protein